MSTGTPARTIDAQVESLRWRAVASEYGIASLRHTHWLDEKARAYEGVPGLWSTDRGRIIGRAVSASTPDVALAPGESIDIGRLRLKAIDRDGTLALRVFDLDAKPPDAAPH